MEERHPHCAGQILRAYGVKDAYMYIGALVMVYIVLAIIAILRTPEPRAPTLRWMRLLRIARNARFRLGNSLVERG